MYEIEVGAALAPGNDSQWIAEWRFCTLFRIHMLPAVHLHFGNRALLPFPSLFFTLIDVL